jgi:hypothetical protein
VWWHGGSPEVPQVPLYPEFDIKFKKNLEFFKKLYFRGFSKIDKRLKTRETEYGTIESKSKPSLQQL